MNSFAEDLVLARGRQATEETNMETRMATYDGTTQERRDVIVHPLTGQVIDPPHAEDVELAEFLQAVDSDREHIKTVRRIVADEVLRRMDRLARWTLMAQGYELVGRSPEPTTAYGEQRHVDYQEGEALRSELMSLVAVSSDLKPEAVEEALPIVKLVRVRPGAIKNLRKLGGRVAEIIDRHAYEIQKPRYVSVKRAYPVEKL